MKPMLGDETEAQIPRASFAAPRRVAHRLVLIQRRLELQASGTGVVVVGLPNVGAGGRGQSRYRERESERQEGPDSERQPA